MARERITGISLKRQRIILIQRINRAGLCRLRREGGDVPEKALGIEEDRIARRLRELTAARKIKA